MIAPGDMVRIGDQRAIAIAPDDDCLPQCVRHLLVTTSLGLWIPVVYCSTGRVDVVLLKHVEAMGPLAQISAATRRKETP